MHNRRRLWTWLWLGCTIPALAGLVWGQAPKGKAAPAPGGAAAKSKSPARAGESVDSGEWEVPPAPVADDPAVRAILETKPTSPKELVRAGKVLAGLGRADLARGFFKQVLDAGLDRSQLAALAEELGPETFVQIVGRPELAPEGRTLAGAVLAAATAQAQDPARIAAWIQKLQDPSADVRFQAMVELQKAHGAAAGPLVAVLADPARAAEHARVRDALVQLGQDAVRPLLGIMDTAEAKIALAAIRVLGDFDDRQIHGYLLGPSARTDVSAEIRQAAQGALLKRVGSVPSRDQARRLLAELARRCFDRKQPMELDPAGQVTTWSWDAAKQQAVAARCSVEEASRRLAIRFARDACLVAPGDKDLLTLYLASLLEQAAWQNGLDRPMPVDEGTVGGQIAGFEPEAIERIVALGMMGDHAPSAAAAAHILGQKQGAARLLVRGGQPSPLALATRHPDRRLRLAAAEAIVRMRPAGSFAGSSWVLEGLDFLAASDGSRRALVAGPRRDDRQRVAGLIANLGYEADTAATGSELLAKATAAPDCELILVDASIDRPTLDFLVQQIRRDGRTAALPVGILALPEVLERARHVAAKDSRSEAFS